MRSKWSALGQPRGSAKAPTHRVHVECRAKTVFSRPQILALIRAVLKKLKLPACEVSFFFVSDREMKRRNLRYKKKNELTDVLAFSQFEGRPFPYRKYLPLGDVIVSADAAKRQAAAFASTEKRECALYIIHGILHLLGHDDMRPAARKKMRAEEKKLMAHVRRALPGLLD